MTHPPVFDGSLPKVHHTSVKAEKRRMCLEVSFHSQSRRTAKVIGKDCSFRGSTMYFMAISRSAIIRQMKRNTLTLQVLIYNKIRWSLIISVLIFSMSNSYEKIRKSWIHILPHGFRSLIIKNTESEAALVLMPKCVHWWRTFLTEKRSTTKSRRVNRIK